MAQKIQVEGRMRELLEENELPEPDHVEYGLGCIRLFFNRPRHVVILNIDEPEDAEVAVDEDSLSRDPTDDRPGRRAGPLNPAAEARTSRATGDRS